MIDTHTHLYLPEFETDSNGAAAVSRALNVGVDHLIFPNVDISTVEPMEKLAAVFPDHISCAMGLHPTEVKSSWHEDLAQIMEILADGSRYVAVGEVGIDLYWDKTFRREQMEAFDMQVARAEELHLPLIIHCRDGLDETLEVMSGHPHARAVFHSFGGTEEDVARIRRIGDFFFGINGIVTFKNSKLRNILPVIGAERLLLETDSPYLAPVPHRGKRNESSFLPHIAAHVAEHMGMTVDEIDSITTANARKLFFE